MLCTKNEVLVQMQHVPSSVNALKFYANVQPNIRGRNVYVQFSSHQELTTMDQSQGRGDEQGQYTTKPNSLSHSSSHAISYDNGCVVSSIFSPWINGKDCNISEVSCFVLGSTECCCLLIHVANPYNRIKLGCFFLMCCEILLHFRYLISDSLKKNSRICYLLFLKLKFSMFFEEILREKGIFFVIPAANFSFGWDLLPTIVFLLNF
uniref:Uncharacterized protein n=1 Tax=Glycine max TaxID=3847 RepID=A0A0R0GLG8_SOYBN